MALELIQQAFIAGELSPALYGRSDLDKYALGLAEATNWFVDYRGGISTRPGLSFRDLVRADWEPTKFFPFRFAPNLANTYVVLFGHLYVRFLQDGSYVLEDLITVSGITQANPGIVTAVAHGLEEGDWIYLEGVGGMWQVNARPLRVGNVLGVDTFELSHVHSGELFDTSEFDAFADEGAGVRRVYTLDSPYTGDELATLKGEQRRDYIRLTRAAHPVRNLIRHDHDDWEIEEEEIGNDADVPQGVEATLTDASGSAEMGYVVTALYRDGTESRGSDMAIATGSNMLVDQSMGLVRWDPVEDAIGYRIYRTNIIAGDGVFGSGKTAAGVTKADMIGYVGRSDGPTFNDQNIIPDFTRTPPVGFNPFAAGGIEHINITAGGTGYDRTTSTVTVTGDGGSGSGFEGVPIVDDNDAIVAVKIINGGEGYEAPVTVAFSVGTGATATAERTPASGTNPTVSKMFQQRQMYAASGQEPLTIWGSRPGLYDNFDYSNVAVDNDSFEFELESSEVAPIRHMLDVRGGLLVMSQSGVWLLRGSTQGAVLTPTDAMADPQGYRGVSLLDPLIIDGDILLEGGKDFVVRLLAYNEISKGFVGRDMSILSNHLFGAGKTLRRWDIAQNPHNFIPVVRSDGKFLFFTLVKEQEVYAWTPGETDGKVVDMCVVYEAGRDVTYFMVERELDGRWTKCIERLEPREFFSAEGSFCLDCALKNDPGRPVAELSMEAATGEDVLFTTDAAVFGGTDVGDVIRPGGGAKAEVTEVLTTSSVRCRIVREVTNVVPGTGVPYPVPSQQWTLDSPFTLVTGLWHLEGKEVWAQADGNVVGPLTVTDGVITLPQAATRVVVGLKYRCQARTLPLSVTQTTIEGRLKSIAGLTVRVNDTRGLQVGARLDQLFPMRERTDEPYGEATRLQGGMKVVTIDGQFDLDGQTYIVQDDPLPATVLGIVASVDLGDDPDDKLPRRR